LLIIHIIQSKIYTNHRPSATCPPKQLIYFRSLRDHRLVFLCVYSKHIAKLTTIALCQLNVYGQTTTGSVSPNQYVCMTCQQCHMW